MSNDKMGYNKDENVHRYAVKERERERKRGRYCGNYSKFANWTLNKVLFYCFWYCCF